MKRHFTTVLLVIILLIGLSLLLYPSVSDYWNSLHQTRVITDYTAQISNMDDDTHRALWDAAAAYNASLLENENRLQPTQEEYAVYESLLNVTGNGIMGYIEIPSIGVSLPMFHGTAESALQVAVGHIAGTSLPTGGTGTHCVLSGHRGLPSAKLFTDLDQLEVGDLFMLNVLDETLTYEVDLILVVDPYHVSSLEIDPEQDLCTLVTCTPYGINTHRLLVRGRRVENLQEEKVIRVTADAVQIEPVVVAPIVGVPLLLLLLTFLFTSRKRK